MERRVAQTKILQQVANNMDEEAIRNIVREELSNINFNNGKKKKRQLSQWQIFLKDCTKKQSKDMGMGEKVKACSVEYKKVKDKLSTNNIEKELK